MLLAATSVVRIGGDSVYSKVVAVITLTTQQRTKVSYVTSATTHQHVPHWRTDEASTQQCN